MSMMSSSAAAAASRRQSEQDEKDAEERAWQGGPLAPNSGHGQAYAYAGSVRAVLEPLQSAQSTGLEISNEIDSLRMELHQLRQANNALQHTNGELHSALAQVTERSKLLSTEHARFLDEFREKSQRSKQKLMDDRHTLKLNLHATNTRLEDLEKLHQTVDADRAQVQRRLDELLHEHHELSQSFEALQGEKTVWVQKEQEDLEIPQLQSRSLEQLNETVLQIQHEREGWHQRAQDTAAELSRAQSHNQQLEQTIANQENMVNQLNSAVLTAQEEIMNLTQNLATHLEQIANISKQNKELHATLVAFTRTNDKQFVEDLSVSSDQSQQRIELLYPSPSAAAATLNASFSPSSPMPRKLSSSFFSPGSRPAAAAATASSSSFVHPSSNAAYNFLHTASSLSTLHLPASYITSKLSSYIVWILEHKQILENMLQRKEKLRKELEEQIVVANLEAQVVHDVSGLRASPLSPIRMRSASPGPLSPSHVVASSSAAAASSALPPPTLLLPSLLQHTLHDLHELTHLTQHDALQFEHFEREKIQILNQCSSSGFNKYNNKRAKTAWNMWVAALHRRTARKEVLHRVLDKLHLRNCAWAMATFSTRVMIRFGQGKLLQQANMMKGRIVQTMLRKTLQSGAAAQKLAFVTWASNARKRRRMRMKLCGAVVNAAENRILRLWTRWKATTLKLRHVAAVEQGRLDAQNQAAAHRAAQLVKLQKMFARRMITDSTHLQRTLFVSWRTWSQTRRVRKRQAMRRIIHICCGQGALVKVWSTWKEFRRSHEKDQSVSTLALTRQQASDKHAALQEHFLQAYSRLRDRYRNFKLFHWWRLAYVDTQWLAREDQWRRALHGQKQLQIRTLVRMRSNYNFLPIFHAWRKITRDNKQGKVRSARKIFLRLINIQKAHAFNRWTAFTEDSRVAELRGQLLTSQDTLREHKVTFAKTLVNKWRKQHLTVAFQHLKDQVLQRRARKRDILDRTIRRIQHSQTWAAFRTWQSFCEKQAIEQLQEKLVEQKGKFASAIIQRWRLGSMVPAFATWRERVAERKNKKREILDRTCRRLQHSALWRAFRTWITFNEKVAVSAMHARLNEHKSRTAILAIRRWQHRILAGPFLNWRSRARRSKAHKREVMGRMVRRLTHTELYRAFRTWSTFIEATKVAAMKAKFNVAKNQLQDEITLQKQKRIKVMIQRWRGESLSTRFQQWRLCSRTSRQKKKVRLEQILRRLVWNQVWKAWMQWKSFNEMHRAHDAQLHAEGALHELRRANTLVLQSTRTKHILKKTLDRMSNLRVFGAWRAWIDFVAASRQNDITQAKRKLELQTQQLQAKQVELVRQHTASNLLAQQRLVDKTLRRIAYSTLYQALRTWKKEAEDRSVFAMQQKMKGKENALKLRLVTSKIAYHRQSALRPLMQRWRKYTRTRKERKQELMQRMVNRMANIRAWQALRHWREWTQSAAVESMRAELNGKLQHQKRARAIALIRTWQHRALMPTFTAWVGYARSNNKRKHLLSKVLARLTNLQLHQGFRAWVNYSKQHRQHQSDTAFRLLRTAAIESKVATLHRACTKRMFVAWSHYARSTRRERSMVDEMRRFRQCDVLDRTFRRVTATGLNKAFQHWRTYILRARLIVNDKLGEYSEMILQLRSQSEHDSLKLHEYATENQKLKSNLLSIKHKSHTLALLSEQQKENRAILFAYNSILSKTFRAFHARVHFLKRRKLVLHKACQHVQDTVTLRALNQWKKQTMRHRGQMLAHALESAKKQLDQCLGKVWSLESQLAQRAAESESVAAESQQLLLNAQAQEMTHQLEKQMPNEREVALAQEVDTLSAKLELMLKEVRERGAHIQFLSSENQRLTTIVKVRTTPRIDAHTHTQVRASRAAAT